MINKIVLEDEIVLYWDRVKEFAKGYKYCVRYGNEIAYTDKTHFSINNLTATRFIELSICLVDENKMIVKEYEKEKIFLPTPKKRIDVSKAPYFAIGDGKTLNTQKIQRALSDCKPNELVYIPKGIYLTGALNVYSDTEVYLEEGAILQGTENPCDYLPKINSRFEGIEGMCYRSLINMGQLDWKNGYNCKNVIIRGKGAILGGGKALMENIIKTETGRSYVEEEVDSIERLARRTRGRLINISNTQNVVIYGIEAGMGPAWNIHITYSDNIVTAGCYIHSEEVQNGDGWDPDSSTNCTIFGCTFFTGDDSVAIKSGKNPEGNIINKPCKHIRVFDCVSKYGHGICIGSEMSGGVEDVYIWDCNLENSMYGIEIKGTKKRGGFVRDIHVKDCALPRIMFHSVGYNDDGIGAESAPVFENCSFERVAIKGVYQDMQKSTVSCDAIELCGFDEPGHELKSIEFSNITLGDKNHPKNQTVSLRLCENISFKNIKCF